MRLICIIGASLSLVLGCGSKKDDGPKSVVLEDAAAARPKEAAVPPSARIGMRSWRSLLSESMRAELDISGISVDFGSADQHKYTRGGWGTGWEEMGADKDGTTFASTSPGTSQLNFWTRTGAREVVFRVRTSGGKASAEVQLELDNSTLAKSLPVSSSWRILRAPISEKQSRTGRVQLKLRSRNALEFDWLWMSTTAGSGEYTNLPRVLPITFDNSTRRSLAAPGSRAFSYFLHVPPSAKLVVDIGSDQKTKFVINAQLAAGEIVELLAATIEKQDIWQERVVDLSRFAGQAIRLEMRTESTPGKTGWGEPEIMVPAKPKPVTKVPVKKAKNLVYVVMDTTRADSFAAIDPETVVETPSYDAMAQKSTTFKNAYNNENWTKPSVTTMWSGLYPGTHNARQATSHVAEDIRFLPQQLQDNGFVTGAFIANAVVSNTFGFNRGWNHFQNDSDDNLNANSRKLYPNATDWLEEHKEDRFFLYVQSIDPHTTYDVPTSYSEKYYKGKYTGSLGSSFDREEQVVVDNGKKPVSGDDLAWIWALYRGEVTYQDQYLGGLLAKIEELGLSDNTLVVITNDHGEEIKDHGAMGHGWPLFEEQLRAPLLMSYPPIFAKGASVADVVEHVDLAPTILDALGVPPMASAEGLSFLPLLEDGIGKRQHPFYAVSWSRKGMRSIRVGRWKLIVGETTGWRHLFDLETDGKEQSSLVKTGKSVPSQALLPGRLCEIYLSEALATPDKAKRMIGASSKLRYDSREISIDAATRKELEALGYL